MSYANALYAVDKQGINADKSKRIVGPRREGINLFVVYNVLTNFRDFFIVTH